MDATSMSCDPTERNVMNLSTSQNSGLVSNIPFFCEQYKSEMRN